mmetsp:Transcript_4400/g.16210  ORF Transcript_4400/g.16210 Transcript_4400/m.16210 type:complete len:413 (-) Transcript_4400:23-1261(-)
MLDGTKEQREAYGFVCDFLKEEEKKDDGGKACRKRDRERNRRELLSEKFDALTKVLEASEAALPPLATMKRRREALQLDSPKHNDLDAGANSRVDVLSRAVDVLQELTRLCVGDLARRRSADEERAVGGLLGVAAAARREATPAASEAAPAGDAPVSVVVFAKTSMSAKDFERFCAKSDHVDVFRDAAEGAAPEEDDGGDGDDDGAATARRRRRAAAAASFFGSQDGIRAKRPRADGDGASPRASPRHGDGPRGPSDRGSGGEGWSAPALSDRRRLASPPAFERPQALERPPVYERLVAYERPQCDERPQAFNRGGPHALAFPQSVRSQSVPNSLHHSQSAPQMNHAAAHANLQHSQSAQHLSSQSAQHLSAQHAQMYSAQHPQPAQHLGGLGPSDGAPFLACASFSFYIRF